MVSHSASKSNACLFEPGRPRTDSQTGADTNGRPGLLEGIITPNVKPSIEAKPACRDYSKARILRVWYRERGLMQVPQLSTIVID